MPCRSRSCRHWNESALNKWSGKTGVAEAGREMTGTWQRNVGCHLTLRCLALGTVFKVYAIGVVL
jgi:hypothetical protein